jgi:hypothetical protein
MLIASSVQAADLWIMQDSRRDMVWTNHVGEARLLDEANKRTDQWAEYRSLKGWVIPQALPAVIDARTWCVSYSDNLRDAKADLKVCRNDQSDVDLINKTARAEWRQVRRDTAQALGLPPTNGLTWSVVDAYTAVAAITNANTRRDLHLRALRSDLTQTRQQLEQQFPAVAWWWMEDVE